MKRSLIVLSVAAVSFALMLVPAADASPAVPGSMAAIGDSITQAYDVCCSYGNHPANSWSTGYSSSDGISSHYELIRSSNSAITGHAYNDSVSGAKMSAAATQAASAVAQGAQYVTMLMGANDVCTSSLSTMTATSTFRSQFQSAMTTLENGLPAGAHVFVSSIPNVYRLWQVLHTNWIARTTWSLAKICQSMLSSSRTETQRQAVLAREREFNDALAAVCSGYVNCRFDGYAVFNYPFASNQVSTLDYFHPNRSGQAAVAATTWTASWWGTAA
jgi:lysophospholipase L1-like esterase